ncbi:MAG: amino acid permease [Sandaracinaceae bacterium]|nr:amino acid permease [Sandaracinaceae bacterium]
MTKSVRALGLFSVLCIGVNAIIGSGIYRLPGRLAHHLGGASWIAFGLVGLLLITVGLCFAEAGGMFSASGGPYVYTREAFGRVPAFIVGWMAWVTMIVSWAAVANAVTGYVGELVSWAAAPLTKRVIVGAMIVLPGALNYFGVKPGAYANNIFTIAKILPLAAFVILGLPHVSWDHVALAPPPSDEGTFAPLGLALFAALFAVQGFEVAPIPAGETNNPRRNVPIAVIGSLVGCSIFYVVIQIVAYAAQPAIASSGTGEHAWSERPLADAARTFLGGGGASLMAVGAGISMMGFCLGSALASPRFLAVLANDRLFPVWLAASHPRFASPHRAIVATSLATLIASQLLDFDGLADIANVAVTLQYIGTCAAITWLRLRKPEHPRTYRVPLGAFVVPVLGVGVCALFLSQASLRDVGASVVVLVIGGVLAGAHMLLARKPA